MQKVIHLGRAMRRIKSAQLGEKLGYELKKFLLEKKIMARGKVIVDHTHPLDFHPLYSRTCSLKGKKFTLLNRSKEFRDDVNWNFRGFGALWYTSLNSFDFLNSENISKDDGVSAIFSFISTAKINKSFCDSHCISQRIINFTKFLSRFKINEPVVNEFLYYQCLYLKKNPEFHQRNHHLLDNGFALLFGSLFFNKYAFFEFAERLLYSNIPKQVLSDGAHFQLSPMYHLLVLQRMLDSLHLLNRSEFTSERFKARLREYIPKMLGWIKQMQLNNGCVPPFNDSAEGFAPGFRSVMRQAAELKTEMTLLPLKESGFRKLRNRNFEMVVDVNGLVPAEAPGHSHADTFHFVLNVFGEPFIVDTGVSTYTRGKERMYERSTMAHNTVVVGNLNQSEIFDSFRVGRRANVIHLSEKANEIEATHDGYAHQGIFHTRKIVLKNDYIEIHDRVRSEKSKRPLTCKAFLHVDKKSGLIRQNDKFVSRFTTIEFSNHSSVSLNDGWHAPGFGFKSPCYVISTCFQNEFITRIKVNKR